MNFKSHRQSAFTALVLVTAALALGAGSASANWTGPTQISLATGETGNIVHAAGSSGGVRLVVRNSGYATPKGQRLTGNWISASGSKGSDFALSANAGRGAIVSQVSIVGNREGDICIAWVEDNQLIAKQTLRARVISRGRTLGAVHTIGGPFSYFDGPAKVGIDQNGRCAVVYSQVNSSDTGFNLKRRTITTSNMSSAQSIPQNDPNASGAGLGALAVAANGTATLAVTTSSYDSETSTYGSGVNVYRFSTTGLGGTTTVVEPLNTISGVYFGPPVVSHDQAGNSVIGWLEGDLDPLVYARAYLRLALVSNSGVVTQLGTFDQVDSNWPNLQMSTDRFGRGAISWNTFMSGRGNYADWDTYETHARRVDSNGPVGDTIVVDPAEPTNIYSGGHSQSVDANGNAYFISDSSTQGELSAIGTIRLSKLEFATGNVVDRSRIATPFQGTTGFGSVAASSCGKAIAPFALFGPNPSDLSGPSLVGDYSMRSTGDVAC